MFVHMPWNRLPSDILCLNVIAGFKYRLSSLDIFKLATFNVTSLLSLTLLSYIKNLSRVYSPLLSTDHNIFLPSFINESNSQHATCSVFINKFYIPQH